MRKDILGVEPQIGDIIVWNPPHYKGLVHGLCVGFMKSSKLPIVKRKYSDESMGTYDETPKTGFVVIRQIKNK